MAETRGVPATAGDESTLLPGERCLHSCWRSLILDSISDGVFTVDSSWRITSFNRAAERITGFSRAEAIGRQCFDVFRADICHGTCALNRTVETGEPVRDVRVSIADKGGERVPISVSTALLRAADGRVVGAVETFRDLSDLEALRRQVEERHTLEEVVGSHPRMRQVLDLVPVVARSDATLLIGGPSGSGKSLLASLIHRLSPRRDGPFVAVSCAALPETLLESELFGHVKGAFTDARRDRAGRIAQAEKGTLFLDEVGELSLAMQVKLLRFLQERAYEPVGSSETRRADVRILTATNRDLARLVAAGAFREDLFYRLAVVELSLPPLAEHREDIPLLVARFVERQRARTGKPIAGVDEGAMEALLAHTWPGNVRELENAVEHAFVLCAGGLIGPEHLPPALARGAPSRAPDAGPIQRAEADAIREALRRHGGNRLLAAQELGLHRSTLWRKIRQYRIT